MLNLPGPGIEPMSPALTGGFLTTGPQGGSSGNDSLICSVLDLVGEGGDVWRKSSMVRTGKLHADCPKLQLGDADFSSQPLPAMFHPPGMPFTHHQENVP